MKRIILGLSILLMVAQNVFANEDFDELGYAILKCFHPTGIYVSTTMYQDSLKIKNGIMKTKGKINYKGGFSGNRYYMKFIYEIKTEGYNKGKQRVTPTIDTAIFPPNPNCEARDWF